jgi:hypothetical protein
MQPLSFSIPPKLHYVNLENEREKYKVSMENKASYFFAYEVTSM